MLKEPQYHEKEFNQTLGAFLADMRKQSLKTSAEIASALGITEE